MAEQQITLKDGLSNREKKSLKDYLEFLEETDLTFHVYNGIDLHPVPDEIQGIILDILNAAVREEGLNEC